MFKNLDGECFGIVGRQNEVIEFALSNGYSSVSVDFSDLCSRAAASGVDFAARYLVSAKMLKVGVGRMNIRFHGTDEELNADIESLNTVFEIVDAMRNVENGADGRVERIAVSIQPYSNTLAYHENFEQHRTRIGQVAEKLAEKSIQLGLEVQAAASRREGKEYEFIYQVEGMVSLIKAVAAENVGLVVNTWDWIVGGGTLEHLTELGVGKMVSVTLTDLPADADLATLATTERLLPGTGDSSAANSVCGWLHENGYTGPLTPGPSSSRFSGSSRDAVIHKAANSIDDILIAVGAIEPVASKIEIPAEPEPSEGEAAEGEAAEGAAAEGAAAEGDAAAPEKSEKVSS